jgi:serine/threonine protein kinase
LTDHCGTPAYLAPEIIADQGYDGFAADLWSLGVLLYALLTGSVPFQAPTTAELQKLILKGKYTMNGDLSKEAKSVVSGLLNLIPKKRIPLQLLVQHPWFRSEQDGFSCLKESGFDEEPELDLDENALDGLKTAGLSRAYIITCLHSNYTNQATATYELMQMHGLNGL